MNYNEYKYRIETHAHTSPVSRCSQIPPADLVRTYKNDGYDAVVMTNHFDPACLCVGENDFAEYYLKDFYEAQNEGEKLGIKVILGCEIRFTENANDYLAYGIDESALKMIYKYIPLGLEAFSREFRSDKTVLLQAHPFRDGMVLANPDLLDGIEVFNLHPGQNSRVGLAAKYFTEQKRRRNDFIALAGSDYHHPTQDGLAGILTKEIPADSFEFAKIILSGEYKIAMGDMVVEY